MPAPQRGELLARWRASLAKLEGDDALDPLAVWNRRLQAKVLRYLINRYEDRRCWNRQPLRRAAATAPTAPRPIDLASSPAAAGESEVRQPPSPQQLRGALTCIEQANLESYREYGVLSR